LIEAGLNKFKSTLRKRNWEKTAIDQSALQVSLLQTQCSH